MTERQGKVYSALRHVQGRMKDGDRALVSEAAVGHHLHMDFAEVRAAAHELADMGRIRIHQGINYELYELI